MANTRRRIGYRQTAEMLRRDGWRVNYKLIYRLYKQAGLDQRTRRRTKRASGVRAPLPPSVGPNQRWSLDFVVDDLANRRRFGIVTLFDKWRRYCPVLEANSLLMGSKVAAALRRMPNTFGKPAAITVDNGSELFLNNGRFCS